MKTSRRPVLPKPRREAAELRARVEALPHWFHSLDLGYGVVTPGVKPLDQLRREWDALDVPDLEGRSVLDIGAWDGFFSFEAERRGASEVTALDHYVWSLDLAAWREYTTEIHRTGAVAEPYEDVPGLWRPDALRGKEPFDLAHQALGSTVEPVVADFMGADLAAVAGPHDVVLFLGVLYHLQDQLGAVERLRSVTGEVAIVETEAIAVGGQPDARLFEFFPTNELAGDTSNWWAGTRAAIEGLCTAAGFSRVEHKTDPPDAEPGSIARYRAVLHAFP